MYGSGAEEHAIDMSSGQLSEGGSVSLTKMVLDTEASGLPHASVAVQVSKTCPLQYPGIIVSKVELFDVPLIRHPPANPLLYGNVLAAGTPPHSTVILPGAVMVGRAAGKTVIVLETEASGLRQISVAVQVSVMVPPQAPEGVCALNVDEFEVPEMRHPPANPLL